MVKLQKKMMYNINEKLIWTFYDEKLTEWNKWCVRILTLLMGWQNHEKLTCPWASK